MTDAASTTTYAYNGDGDRVSQDVDGTLTTYTLDTATPLTRLLAETTGPDTTFTLHGLGLVTQSDGSTTEYFSADGLGSVRQLTDSTGSVLLNQTFDPYGNPYVRTGPGDTRFGFTGEQVDGNGLVCLRARYYNPSHGRFLNADPSRQERNPYQYGLGNPVKYIDPSGLQRIITETDWKAAGGHPARYSAQTLNMISEHRTDIIAAATRHYVALQQSYSSKLTDFTLEGFRDTLLALIYTEGWGFYEVDAKRMGGLYNAVSGSNLDAIISAGGFSLGVGQIRPDTTALEIERAGILYQTCNLDGAPNLDPIPAKVGHEGFWQFVWSGGWVWLQWVDTSRLHRVNRLLDPTWGIEYTAANMHWAMMQPDFFDNWRWPSGTLGRPMSVEERMATWHTQGLFDLSAPDPVDDGHGNMETMGQLLQNYLHLVHGTKQALLRLQVWHGDWKAQ